MNKSCDATWSAVSHTYTCGLNGNHRTIDPSSWHNAIDTGGPRWRPDDVPTLQEQLATEPFSDWRDVEVAQRDAGLDNLLGHANDVDRDES